MTAPRINQGTLALARPEYFEREVVDFVSGLPYRHPCGLETRFHDDGWVVQPKAPGKHMMSVSFHGLPSWIVWPAKLYLTQGWLVEGRSPNWVCQRIGGLRRIASFLTDFIGPTCAELTPDHGRRVRVQLGLLLDTAQHALEEAVRAATPRSLSARERKAAVRSSGGRLSVGDIAHSFNEMLQLLRDREGWEIDCHVSVPSAEGHRHGPGGADPTKVLGLETETALFRACARELHRYERAVALIRHAYSKADWSKGVTKELNPTPIVCRYLGLDGYPVQSSYAIAEAIGWTERSGPEIGRFVRRTLTERLGKERANAIMALRVKLSAQKGGRATGHPTHRRIIALCTELDLQWEDPARLAIEHWLGIRGERPLQREELSALFELRSARGPQFRVQRTLPRLLGTARARRVLYLRNELPFLLSRAIKAMAVQLQLCTARRVGGLLDLPVEPGITEREAHGLRIVEISFRSFKMWGDEGAPDPVPCTDIYGELALSAIRTTQALTATLRAHCDEETAKRLFIIPSKGRSFATGVVLSDTVLHEYVYVNQAGKDGGILRRYRIPTGEGFQLHHVRHTHATRQLAAGGMLHVTARYLGHDVVNNNPLHTHDFYVAGGSDAIRRASARAIARGAAAGIHFNALARVAIESLGGVAAVPAVPAAELPYEVALQRICEGDILEQMPSTAEDVLAALRNGIVLNMTRYGGCLLKAEDGPCPAHERCPLGIEPESAATYAGCGCKHQVILPHAEDQLAADLELMRAQRTKMLGEEWATWRSHLDVKISIWEMQLRTARQLKALLGGDNDKT